MKNQWIILGIMALLGFVLVAIGASGTPVTETQSVCDTSFLGVCTSSHSEEVTVNQTNYGAIGFGLLLLGAAGIGSLVASGMHWNLSPWNLSPRMSACRACGGRGQISTPNGMSWQTCIYCNGTGRISLGVPISKRNQKLGLLVFAVVAVVAFSVPFLFRHPASTTNGGNGGNGGSGGNGNDPAVKWQGWHGFCHGQGSHQGIVKKAAQLEFNLTRIC